MFGLVINMFLKGAIIHCSKETCRHPRPLSDIGKTLK